MRHHIRYHIHVKLIEYNPKDTVSFAYGTSPKPELSENIEKGGTSKPVSHQDSRDDDSEESHMEK